MLYFWFVLCIIAACIKEVKSAQGGPQSIRGPSGFDISASFMVKSLGSYMNRAGWGFQRRPCLPQGQFFKEGEGENYSLQEELKTNPVTLNGRKYYVGQTRIISPHAMEAILELQSLRCVSSRCFFT